MSTEENTMKVAILGAGSVGMALASALSAADVEVSLGVRDLKKTQSDPLLNEMAGVSLPPTVQPLASAAVGADLVLLAVPAAVAIDVALEAGKGAANLAGQILVDCTNPLGWSEGPVWRPPPAGSMSAALALALPQARVVKGFNHFGAEIQADPRLLTGAADAFFAADDVDAKRQVMALATRMGFVARDAGPLRNAAVLENFAVLWIHMAMTGDLGREFGFRIDPRYS